MPDPGTPDDFRPGANPVRKHTQHQVPSLSPPCLARSWSTARRRPCRPKRNRNGWPTGNGNPQSRPGGGAPAATASAKIGSTSLGLKYTTTAADLAAPGDWICRIFNASLVSPVFTTKITSSAHPPVIVYPIKSASFDIPLLGTLLQEVVETAAVRIHLEASGDGSNQSVASWSVPIANLIGGDTSTGSTSTTLARAPRSGFSASTPIQRDRPSTYRPIRSPSC